MYWWIGFVIFVYVLLYLLIRAVPYIEIYPEEKEDAEDGEGV